MLTGPRIYFSTRDDHLMVSKKLHMDTMSAAHILVYASDVDPWRRGLEWLVFRPGDLPAICQYLQERHLNRKPKISQLNNYYLDSEDLFILADRDVKPFHFSQKPGQAVFIAAGCAYQVGNC